MTISFGTENLKWWISGKNTLKLPKLEKSTSQEPFTVR